MSLARIFQLDSSIVFRATTSGWTRSYAKPATSSTTSAGTGIQSLGKGAAKSIKGLKALKTAPTLEKKVLPVETDTKKLVTYLCGSNIMKEGEDIKLGADEEYPEWLWSLRMGPPPPPEELEYDSAEYWKRVRRLSLRRQNSLRHLKKFPIVHYKS